MTAMGDSIDDIEARAALPSLGRALCDDWVPYGIHVNRLAPGYILTE
jgi:NAD(P)-dependent dehydrogenase (short-subunit alcohol dehydrogenase family)